MTAPVSTNAPARQKADYTSVRDRVVDQLFDRMPFVVYDPQADDHEARLHCHQFYEWLASETGFTFDTLRDVDQVFGIWRDWWHSDTRIAQGKYPPDMVEVIRKVRAEAAIKTVFHVRYELLTR